MNDPIAAGPAAAPRFADVAVVALVADRWDRAWQSRHHILSRLARYFHVVWCNEPDEWRAALAVSKRAPAVPTPDNLAVFQPGLAEARFHRPGLLARLTERRRYRAAVRLARARGARRIILYLWRPQFAGALEAVAYDRAVYHIDDEYSFSRQAQGLDPVERALMASVDQVFIHSRAMMDRKGNVNANTRWVPNGVDFAAFSAPQAEPDDLRGIARPRVGYVGYLKSQLDFSLLDALAARRPEWSFVFVGPTGVLKNQARAFAALMARPNAFLLGPRPRACLPGYVQHVDVCTMCYNIDEYTRYIYPLKTHEYLAAGRPVVATPIPSLREFGQVLALARSVDDWEAAILRCLAEPGDSDKARARRRVAARHDWDRIVDDIARHFCDLLGESRESRASRTPSSV